MIAKKNKIIVTEGEFDAKVLKKLFEGKVSNLNIIPANGYSSALSKVRSLLSINYDFVILIIDADTIDINELNEKKEFVKSYTNAKFYNNRFKVFWAVPEFEIIFLNNDTFLKKIVKHNLTKDIIKIGQLSPKRTLQQISSTNIKEYIRLLEDEEIRDSFFKKGLIKEIYNLIK